MLKEYYAERELKERGVRLIYEAEGDTNNTKVSVVDNGNSTTGSTPTSGKFNKEALTKILNSLSEWFDKMIESFEEVILRKSEYNKKWLADNKEKLSTRSYSNVTINILPYDKMPSKQIIDDIGKVTNNVNTMTTQNMQGINKYEDLRSKIIIGPKFTGNNETADIVNYYKIGTNPLQVVEYSNSDIKTLVVNEMIPFCENFYDSYRNDVKAKLTALKQGLENINKTYVTEASDDISILNIFTEAEDATQPTVNQPNTTSTTTTTVQKTTAATDENKSSNNLLEKSKSLKPI